MRQHGQSQASFIRLRGQDIVWQATGFRAKDKHVTGCETMRVVAFFSFGGEKQ